VFPDLHRLGGLHRLHRLHRLVDLPARIHVHKPWKRTSYRHPSRSTPSIAHLLLAGLAVFAFVKLMSAANRPNRFRPRTLAIGILLLVVGAFVMSLRRSARRHGW
jgi:hypothetical protein